jgi:putative N6-adenine-specific DNA methylase
LRVGEARAREFGKLRRLVSKLDWKPLVDPTCPVRFEITQRSSRLYHTGAIAETLALAIEDRVGGKLVLASPGIAAEDGSVQRVFARGESDLFTFSVDASGELLHRRGWRQEAGEAPLRETLAAGLLALAAFDPARPFVDLMCGAGTIVIEAAAWAAGRAPGAGRSFGFEKWPGFEAGAWAAVRGELAGLVAAPVALGFDRDPEMVAIAARNAERAGLADRARFAVAPLGDAAVPRAPTGLVVVNPPYGRRLGTRGEATRAVRALGRTLARDFAGWTAGVLLGEAGQVKVLGLPVRKTVGLWNGGVKVSYVIVDVPG